MPGASALLITSPPLADAARALLERWAPDAGFVVWTPGDHAAAQALRRDLLRQRWSWGVSFYNDYLFNAEEIGRFTDLFNIHPALPAIRGRGYDVLPLIERHGEYGVTLHRVAEAIDAGSSDGSVVVRRRMRVGLTDQGFDFLALNGRQQLAVGLQRRARGQHHPLGLHPRLTQAACGHIFLGMGKAVTQHARHLVIGQPVAGLDGHRGLDARLRLLR